ncbi:MAG: phosphoribosylformylglycinamidine synthase, partial [Lentisphaerae bacterium]|nr:phosphoribosylformylglycinamidine synthase [Lentisphaerota bacterium]
MSYRIEIGLKRGVHDAPGHGVRGKAEKALGIRLRSVQTRRVFKVDAQLSAAEQTALRRAFADPVVEVSGEGRLRAPKFDWLIEVGFRPGVTDNVGRTARVVAADVLGRPLTRDEAVYTATQYFVRAPDLSRETATRLARDLLANPLIQSIQVFSAEEWGAVPPDESVPAIREPTRIEVGTFDLSGSDADLLKLSRDKLLSCSLDEMRAIRDYFRRPAVVAARKAMGLPDAPTDVEVESVAQTWSEHCKHKIFAGIVHYTDENGKEETIDSLFKTYIRGSTEAIAKDVDWMVSVFTDNAGIIRLNDRLNVVYKVETHNSPSALDPYGGAMTGIVGVNRDPMGTGIGASLLCNVWGYCLGSPFYDGDLPEGLMHPRRIRDGVHLGVIEGGNQSGIPWARGWEVFDERFIGKPLVYCGTVGLIPRTIRGRPSEEKTVRPGDKIVMLGGRIGKDGIHGATFSSEELHADSPVQAVQIGDPITQRKMYEFLMEARDLGLYRSITDNGAGGLSCSIGEMGRESGGADLDLALAPLKYEGLKPWEILLSEAQERMTLALQPENVEAFLDLARRRDVDATVLGTFTDSGFFLVRYAARVVGRLDMEFLHEGCPVMRMEARWTPPSLPAPTLPRRGPRDRLLKELLGSLSLCSREYKSRQYDGEVKGLSVIKPHVGVFSDMPSDATVLRVDYASNEGILLAEGINPFYSDLDTYAMMTSVIDEAVRRIVSAGGRLGDIAGLDNFCWPDPVRSEKTPDGEYKMAQLVRAN